MSSESTYTERVLGAVATTHGRALCLDTFQRMLQEIGSELPSDDMVSDMFARYGIFDAMDRIAYREAINRMLDRRA
ncbi:MAG TPA: hypothetical protein VJH33_02190 [Candidatus Paceibacterota bacterium]